MKYSFNRDKTDIIFAHGKDINSSYKDLCAVCDSIRYKSVPRALTQLQTMEDGQAAVLYKRHNKGMGSRHELGGRKGRYPMKSAGIVSKVLTNAIANARNKGFEPDIMFIVHACANKTEIAQRAPSKGVLYMGAGYGYAAARRSNLEFAKVEIGLAKGTEKGLSENMKNILKRAQAFEAARPQPKIVKRKDDKKAAQKQKPKEQKADTEQKRQQESRQPPRPKVEKRPKEGLPPKAEQ